MIVRSPEGRIRFQKQLSFSEPIILIGNSAMDTTIGGIPGKIEAGEWQIGIFIFAEHVERLLGEQKVAFTITVSDKKLPAQEVIGGPVWADENFHYTKYDFDKVYQSGTRWYKGDLHTHTRLSDGKELPQSANIKSGHAGLDFYVPTEHNVLHTGWPDSSVMIVPGVEITSTLGHANLFGIDRMPGALEKVFLGGSMADMVPVYQSILAECRRRGWLFSVNHPFLYIWKWLWEEMRLSDIDCLEIINDPTYQSDPEADARTANEQAVRFADLLWEDGYRICAVGGSDSHNYEQEWYPGADGPSIPGDPSTFLYMEALTPNNMIHAIQNCRCYVTRHCQINSNLIFGSILPRGTKEVYYQLELMDTKEEPVIFYIYDSIKYLCEPCRRSETTYTVQGSITLPDTGYHWIRFGAETQRGDFLFYGNALTIGKKEPTTSNFKKMKEKLEEQWKLKEYYSTRMAP